MAMTLVSTVTVGSGGAASIEFTGIAGTGKDLVLLFSTRSDTSGDNLRLRLNGDTGTNYTRINLRGSGAAASSVTGTQDFAFIGQQPETTHTANTFGNGLVYLSNYTSTTNKSFSGDVVSEQNATTAWQILTAGSYSTSLAITSLTLFPVSGNFVQHSTASLYIIS